MRPLFPKVNFFDYNNNDLHIPLWNKEFVLITLHLTYAPFLILNLLL